MTSPTLLSRVGVAFASAGYAGFFPFAPGTIGSAVALPLWFLLRRTDHVWAEPLCIAVFFVIGAWSARVMERTLGVEDPGPVVIDEVVGMLVTLLWLPVTWQVALAGFVAFRVFDIIKPYPADRLEHVPHGWGVMADDVMAGAYAYATLRLGIWLKPEWWT